MSTLHTRKRPHRLLPLLIWSAIFILYLLLSGYSG